MALFQSIVILIGLEFSFFDKIKCFPVSDNFFDANLRPIPYLPEILSDL